MKEVFGVDVHQHYVDFYSNEIIKFEENISSWEKKRYLDLI
jgi:glutamine synthetase